MQLRQISESRVPYTGLVQLPIDMAHSDYCLKPIELDELVEKIIIAYNDSN